MPVSDENLDLYLALQVKSQALYDYIDRLIDSMTVGNASFVNIKKERAEFELTRVEAMMSQLDNNSPITFPSDEAFQDMRRSVAALQQAIAASAALTDLIDAGDAMIAAWPVS